ncbi:hypothetical protein Tco_1089633 [Tanacetum coccineum]
MISKHLWHVAVDKDSLWVKWINTYKLKGRCIWKVNEDVNDSWGWMNILRMGQLVSSYMFKKVRNGATTLMWFDYWTDMGRLCDTVTYRDLYDVRMQSNMTVRDFFLNGNGQWPEESLNGNLSKFSVKQAYYDIMKPGKLNTQNKVRSWGLYDIMACPLCFTEMDSHNHLFFEFVSKYASMQNGNSIRSIVRRFCLVASVYFIWQERNYRIFKDVKRTVEEVKGTPNVIRKVSCLGGMPASDALTVGLKTHPECVQRIENEAKRYECMSTCSSYSNLFPPFIYPESVILARQRNLDDPSLLLDFEEINMNSNNVQGAPPAGPPPQNHNGLPGPNLHMSALDLRTMKELCQPIMNGRGGSIAPINIQASDFGLKNHMIQQVQNSCHFTGYRVMMQIRISISS